MKKYTIVLSEDLKQLKKDREMTLNYIAERMSEKEAMLYASLTEASWLLNSRKIDQSPLLLLE